MFISYILEPYTLGQLQLALALFSMKIIFQCLWIDIANLNTDQKFLIPTQVDEVLVAP